MDRLVLFVIVCTAQLGCQNPGFDPVSFGRQTRVPPPPTGVVGESGGFRAPASLPPASAGAQMGPGHNWSDVQSDVQYGTGNYWEPLPDSRSSAPRTVAEQPSAVRPSGAVAQRPFASESVQRSELRQTDLRQNDRLTWRDPDIGGIPGPLRQPDVGVGTDYDSIDYAPRLMPNPGPASAIASSPPRIGIPSSHPQQPLQIPAELAEFQRGAIRPASATSSNWQSRYDDVRR